ncbi:SDR family NAD(P)-dependent oxidoreductase [Paraburkholderia saeva]|uniref:SDR family NAD(P)-dependent oxidoreductase n=1 Tax=Paraburkholderia saeva TaxID=2777537 RepID=UPI001D7BEF6F|nr:SDR family NAD(P)-dependent oxidoreductase [Paraburkholderia saeva]CAG4895637.1 3-oxoacyl-[acyl-carrier-protein] reductase FabG [Paraburkholderia saeva]
MANSLDGKVVAVTGGFGSLGFTVAQVLSERGVRVALVDRALGPHPGTLPRSLADALIVGGVDLGTPQAAQDAIDSVGSRLGGLDALINIAGGFRWETVADGSADTWDLMYQMNVKTALNASKASLRYLLASSTGRIVNISAGAALRAGAGMGAYSASKAGVARLTEAFAEELKDKGVTVNAVLPSIIDTAQNRADMPDADFTRWVAPEKIGAVIAFLLSPDADAITGALLPVAGRV